MLNCFAFGWRECVSNYLMSLYKFFQGVIFKGWTF